MFIEERLCVDAIELVLKNSNGYGIQDYNEAVVVLLRFEFRSQP